MRPAPLPTLDDALAELFPPGVAVAASDEPGDVANLLPEEAAGLGRAVARRAREFAAGRACARRALATLGFADFALRVGEQREPLWPAGVIGSITHTEGLCAAVVARTGELAGLGLDAERAGRVKPELWGRICLPAELRWLQGLMPSEQPAAATLLFAAKEAFYKAQFPLTRRWLYFHDASIEIPGPFGARGPFHVHPLRDLAIAGARPAPLQGQYRFLAGHGLAAVTVAASGAAQ